MIKFEDVTEENFKDIVSLRLKDYQKKFVADNTYSLAQCYIYRNNGDVFLEQFT